MFDIFKRCKHENSIKERIMVGYYTGWTTSIAYIDGRVEVYDMFYCKECKNSHKALIHEYKFMMDGERRCREKMLELSDNGIKQISPEDWKVINIK